MVGKVGGWHVLNDLRVGWVLVMVKDYGGMGQMLVANDLGNRMGLSTSFFTSCHCFYGNK